MQCWSRPGLSSKNIAKLFVVHYSSYMSNYARGGNSMATETDNQRTDGGPLGSLEQSLQWMGFTDYEARAYIALLRKSPLTGYELAKLSRIPRANIYDVLRKLVDRGTATQMASEDGVGYLAVSPDAVLRRMREQFDSTLADIERQALELAQLEDHCYVEQFEGRDNLIAFVKDAIHDAERSLTLATCPQEAGALQASLAQAAKRGLRCDLICLYGCKTPCAGCKEVGQVTRDPMGSHDVHARPFRLVVDGRYLVTAEIDEQSAAGVRTRLPALVKMAERYVRQTALLAQQEQQ